MKYVKTMKFNDTTNLTGIIQACEDYTGLGNGGISGNATLLKQFTRYINTRYRQIRHWIFETQNAWIFDDGNATNLPEATADLVSAQARYALPDEALEIQKVEAKNSAGDWVVLEPIVLQDFSQGVDEFLSTDGTPKYYRLEGETIELFPATNYSSTGGLKLYFNRDIVEFSSSDTTKEPGFASPYHNALAVGGSLEWMEMKRADQPSTAILRNRWAEYKPEIQDFYSNRLRNLKPRLKTKQINWE